MWAGVGLFKHIHIVDAYDNKVTFLNVCRWRKKKIILSNNPSHFPEIHCRRPTIPLLHTLICVMHFILSRLLKKANNVDY